ncbi:MAG: ATP-binding protein [Planctomycetota bacterium]|nr:ATP-binding protein [Planctomycetota bacterium]
MRATRCSGTGPQKILDTLDSREAITVPDDATIMSAVSSRPPMVGREEQLPAWYPAWARELAEAYFSRTTCVFVLHGNVHDLIQAPVGDQASYSSLPEFLSTQVFGKWDLVIGHDLSRGLRLLAGNNAERLRSMVQYLTARWGEPATWPREPDKVLLLLDSLVERMLLEDPGNRKHIAVIFEYGQYLVPAGDLSSLAQGSGARLVRFLGWAQNPHIKRVNMAFCLIADRVAEVNERLVQNPYVTAIEVPLPDRDQRRRFIDCSARDGQLAKLTDFSPDQLADMSNGLSLVNLNVVLGQAVHAERRIDAQRFRLLKKTMIERQCRDLVEFVEPDRTLDLVVGYDEAKQRLQQDAEWISRGQTDAAPMGYLICGPVGTGKTFLAECYAGSIGIPCVMLKNFRSKYVGETEGNLQQVLTVLRSLGPVVVIVDEADAALGSRRAEGDSGTSARVFSMIASQMGNTRYRGKIIWMLLTSRPDLLPIDLKRQGRAEVHIPLMYPRRDADIRALLTTLARKNKIALAPDAVPPVSAERKLTGADIEGIVLNARRSGLSAGRQEVTREDLERALAEFVPSAQGLEKELQELAAVVECTQMSFLPDDWRQKLAQPGATAQLQERMAAIRQLLND